jgi:DNA-directed RNA polymerase subunit RPC12/RpoP
MEYPKEWKGKNTTFRRFKELSEYELIPGVDCLIEKSVKMKMDYPKEWYRCHRCEEEFDKIYLLPYLTTEFKDVAICRKCSREFDIQIKKFTEGFLLNNKGQDLGRKGNRAMKDEPGFAFGKKLGVAECLYGNRAALAQMIERLMVCMKETNQHHGVECEFFRIDFRQPYFDEIEQFPRGALILDMKWGSKKELMDAMD